VMPAIDKRRPKPTVDPPGVGESHTEHYANGHNCTIRETGDRLVYWVSSHTDPRKYYKVDLEANSHQGVCNCPHFEFRVVKARKEGFNKARCRHISILHDFLAKKVIDELARQYDKEYGRKDAWHRVND